MGKNPSGLDAGDAAGIEEYTDGNVQISVIIKLSVVSDSDDMPLISTEATEGNGEAAETTLNHVQ